jgi:hypothetical protein
MANDVLIETPLMQNKEKLSPHQIFANTRTQPNPKHWKPFCCPLHVLDSSIQGGRGIIHKWKQRSKVGTHLGRSPQHARSVGLVLDRQTALVSPQFHVTFDPSFHTCKQDEFDSKWQLKAGFVAQREPEPKSKTKTAPNNQATESPPKQQRREADRSELNNQLQHHVLEIPNQPPEPPEESVRNEDKGSSVPTNNRTTARKRQPIERLMEAMAAEMKDTSGEIEGEIFCLVAMYPVRDEDKNPLLAYKASADPDTMYVHEAMKEPDKKEFIKAMQKEVSDQSNNKNFSIIHRSEVPEGATILPTVWQMKRKRDIKTREIKKWKARLNVDGSHMHKGKHYWETYAPVVSWQSIRLLLTMSALHNWHAVPSKYE